MDTRLLGIEVILLVFVLTVVLTRLLIPRLQKRHACQYILEIGPDWHKSKEGTPTMGGLAPLIAVVICSSVFVLYHIRISPMVDLTPFLLTLLFACANAVVGIFDDSVKLAKRQNAGLTPWQKLVLQLTFAVAYLIFLRLNTDISTSFSIPFFNIEWNLGWFWYPISTCILIWFVNTANLTDGIDGLASSVGVLVGIFFILLSVKTKNTSLVLSSSAMVGAALGFFIFNRHPAKIFMGDTGSLFFGALAVGCSFIAKSPLLIFLVGIVYVWEGVSVVLQVIYFKLTRGKRLFRMAPFHHHLEKKGWSEWKIVALSSFITFAMASLTLWVGI